MKNYPAMFGVHLHIRHKMEYKSHIWGRICIWKPNTSCKEAWRQAAGSSKFISCTNWRIKIPLVHVMNWKIQLNPGENWSNKSCSCSKYTVQFEYQYKKYNRIGYQCKLHNKVPIQKVPMHILSTDMKSTIRLDTDTQSDTD